MARRDELPWRRHLLQCGQENLVSPPSRSQYHLPVHKTRLITMAGPCSGDACHAARSVACDGSAKGMWACRNRNSTLGDPCFVPPQICHEAQCQPFWQHVLPDWKRNAGAAGLLCRPADSPGPPVRTETHLRRAGLTSRDAPIAMIDHEQARKSAPGDPHEGAPHGKHLSCHQQIKSAHVVVISIGSPCFRHGLTSGVLSLCSCNT